MDNILEFYKQSAISRVRKSSNLEEIDEALKHEGAFDSATAADIKNLAAVADDLLGNIGEVNDQLPDSPETQKIREKLYQLGTILGIMSEKVNFDTIEAGGSAMYFLKQYKEVLGSGSTTDQDEKYLKGSMLAFIGSKGLSKEYHNQWRYKYSFENMAEFRNTTFFHQYIDELSLNGNREILDQVETRLREVNEE